MFLTFIFIFVVGLLILLYWTIFIHMFFRVPYVPSRTKVVEKMIRAAGLRKGDCVVDLGCGDGRLLLAAEKKGASAEGYEIAPLVFFLAWMRKFIARSKMKLHFQSLFSAPLKKANVIFCYLLPNVMPPLAEKIKKECRRGTRVISNTFSIPGLKLYKILTKNPAKGLPTIYIYKV